MNYSGNTSLQQKEMLKEIGVESLKELFNSIPEKVKIKNAFNFPQALSEIEVIKKIKELADKNQSAFNYPLFLGAGYYDHFIPAAVKYLTQRAEFFTAYTPYQPEASQGTLQVIYEYQSFITLLTGMDVSNASLYDGATALSEAVVMASRINNRKIILVSQLIHPEYLAVLKTYLAGSNLILKIIPHREGTTDLEVLKDNLNNDVCAVVFSQPNFFGIFDEVKEAGRLAGRNNSLFIVSVDPVALGIISSPAEWGADIAVGEGQALGSGLNFGGPGLGFMACRKEFVRKMPGRIVGRTEDIDGKTGYVLTLQTREQHIRREKATSNICSNHALNALAATIYLSLMGKNGFRKIAELSLQKAHYAADRIAEIPGCELKFRKSFFKEFVISLPHSIDRVNRKLLENKIIGGLDLERFYTASPVREFFSNGELKNTMLLAVTEKRTKEEIDRLVEVLKNV